MSQRIELSIVPENIGKRQPEEINNDDIQDLRSASPEFLSMSLENARLTDNDVLVGAIAAFAIESARTVLVKNPGVKAYRQLDYLDIARSVFPGLEV